MTKSQKDKEIVDFFKYSKYNIFDKFGYTKLLFEKKINNYFFVLTFRFSICTIYRTLHSRTAALIFEIQNIK